MSTRKEGRQFIAQATQAARAAGWQVEKVDGTHWRFRPADPTIRQIILSDSGSDHRSIANSRRQLARLGLDLNR